MTVETQPGKNEWKNGLFECCDSIRDCCLGYWCPSCYAAYASDLSEEPFLVSALQCLFYPLGLFYLRPVTRDKHDIEGSLLKDILVVCCCPCCATIQIKREFEDDDGDDDYEIPQQYEQFSMYQQPPQYQQHYQY